jgi:putative addiction module killer protein
MVEIRQTEQYADWFSRLKDRMVMARINTRVFRLQEGNPGQYRNLAGGVSEMKIDHGPGYRVYYTKIGTEIVLPLLGGTKPTQQEDITEAQRLVRELSSME